jgi:catechol 2,3-dioxygenase-like lactoylglutathione lyase family enzyme
VAWAFSYQLIHIQMLAATESAPAIRRKKWRNKADRDIVPSGDLGRAAYRTQNNLREGGTTMAYAVQHVHIKTRDPKQTSQFYIDNFGATMKAEIPGRGFRLDLHGLQLNITTLIDSQKHQQHYGIEHIAVQTDDYQGTLAKLKANGVRILEEMPPKRPPRLFPRGSRRRADGPTASWRSSLRRAMPPRRSPSTCTASPC